MRSILRFAIHGFFWAALWSQPAFALDPNNDGIWNATGASFAFYVRPRFYQTYWFLGLGLAGLALAGVGLFRLRVRRLRKREQELMLLVNDRTKELQQEIAERRRVEEALHRAHDQLEVRVQQRTAELARANEVLQEEIRERQRAEKERDQLLAREQAARREAEAANRMKDEFLATVSHELRTPLTSILGWARMLRSGELDETMAARAMETIERNAQSQAQIIEDLLDVSRIITGTLRLKIRPTNVATVIESAVDVVRPAVEAKAIAIEFIAEQPACWVSGDPDRLKQVIWNLLSNAVKFTPKGGRVEIRLTRTPDQARVQVRDTGQGIRGEFLPYVFDRFRQADSSSTRKHGGLGLGLAIVRHLVELHGGAVQVESPGEGQGATFTVSIPLASDLSAVGVRRPSAMSDSRKAFRKLPALDGLKVLVVDDEVDARAFVTLILEKCQAEVIAVASVPEALEVIEQGWPDILVSDIGMPEEDGYALIRKLRAREPERGGDIPALALTAYVRAEDRTNVLAAGYQEHITKPVEPVELVTAIANLAGRMRVSD